MALYGGKVEDGARGCLGSVSVSGIGPFVASVVGGLPWMGETEGVISVSKSGHSEL